MATLPRGLLLLAGAVGASAAWRTRRRRRAMLYDLRGRTALVTGGSRGLGFVLARRLVEAGARVAICGRDADTLERARTALDHLGGEVLAVPCDVGDPAAVEAMLRVVREWFGPLDVLINDAGTIVVGPEADMTREDFASAMRTNFWGTLHVTRAALPDLRRRPGSRIVNITSIGGKLAIPHLLPYSASKFAAVGYSLGLRAELAPDGVVVTTVCPGLMRTGSPPNALFKGRHRAEYAWFSMSDSLPLLSMDAEYAAARILLACRRGEAELVFPWHMRAAVIAQALAPELVASAMTLAARLLPGPGGSARGRTRGWDSQSLVSPSWLTTLGDRATERYNQTVAQPVPSRL